MEPLNTKAKTLRMCTKYVHRRRFDQREGNKYGRTERKTRVTCNNEWESRGACSRENTKMVLKRLGLESIDRKSS